jgi:hypothetical protein
MATSEDSSGDESFVDADNQMEVDQRKASKKRKLNADGSQEDDWKNAVTTDDKLGLIFVMLTSVKQEVKGSRKEVRQLKGKVNKLEEASNNQMEKISQLEFKNAELNDKVAFLMSGGPTNLIMRGLAEDNNEETQKKVVELITKIVGRCNGITAAYRIGGATTRGPRLIKIKMSCQGSKEDLLKLDNINKLREFNAKNNTRIQILSDQSFLERKQRKATWEAFQDVKKTDPAAILRKGIIISQQEKYKVDHLGAIQKLSNKI